VPSLAAAPEPLTAASGRAPAPDLAARRRARAPLLALAVGVALCVLACTFVARGGTDLERSTWTEIGLVLAGGAVVATTLLAPRRGAGGDRLHGGLAVIAFAAVCAYTALSIVWSLAPGDSWLQANLAFAYLAVFAAGAGLARRLPGLWKGVLYGLAAAAVVVSGCALLTKVFPAALAPDEPFARLRPPFDYWNSVGLAAALGIFPLLWLGTRRSGHAAYNALAWPGIGLLLLALLLAYSRGALLVLAAALGVWFALVPLRLRGVVVLAATALTATPIVAFAFAQDGLTRNYAPMAARTDAGAELGALLLLMLACLLAAGLAVGFLSTRHPLPRRRRRAAGRMLLVALALVPLVALLMLARAPGGLSGQVSKAWHNAVSPRSKLPSNSPDRLTATASVRSRYWQEAAKINRASPVLGTGAGSFGIVRTRVRADGNTDVRHAHSYVMQTLSDLGWVGLGLSLLATLAWLVAAARTLGLRRGGMTGGWDAERVGLAALAVMVVTFGLHSALDWTWYVPGNAVPALIAAGWLAGRGPLRPAPAAAPRRRSAWRYAAAAVTGAAALATAWTALQPLRAAHAEDAAFARLALGQYGPAANIARIAHRRDPLSVDPLWDLAAIEQGRGHRPAARQALQQAVQLEPANAETWRRLGDFELATGDPRAALSDYRAAYYLDPKSAQSTSDVIVAARAVSAAPAPPAAGAKPRP
jgi:O-Antigen ligase